MRKRIERKSTLEEKNRKETLEEKNRRESAECVKTKSLIHVLKRCQEIKCNKN